VHLVGGFNPVEKICSSKLDHLPQERVNIKIIETTTQAGVKNIYKTLHFEGSVLVLKRCVVFHPFFLHVFFPWFFPMGKTVPLHFSSG